jgi:cell division topological specificity factor
VIDFFNRLFNPKPSSVTARERLRLVLLSDHLALAPDVIESLKLDLIAVISKYVDVDAANCDVTFEQQDRQVAMLANIPILGMKPAERKPTPGPGAPLAAASSAKPPDPPRFSEASPATTAVADPPIASMVVAGATEDVPETASPSPKPRRRRRRRAPVAAPAAG